MKNTDEFRLSIEAPTRDGSKRYYAGIRIYANEGSEPDTSDVESNLKSAHFANEREFVQVFAKYLVDWLNDNRTNEQGEIAITTMETKNEK